jgi:hypothetical protein
MKNLKNLLKKSALAMSIIALSSTQAFAGSGTVSFKLLASDGTTGVSGAAVQYFKGGEQLLGYTDANGEYSKFIDDIPGTTTFYIRPSNGGRKIWLSVDPATNPTLTAQMVAVTINLNSSKGTPLAGNALYYAPSGWTNIGSTPATIDLLPSTGLVSGQGAYDFRTSFEGRTSQTLRQDIASNSTVNFNTTLVHMDYNKTIQYYNNGGWQNFQSPKEMLGGTQNFPNNNVGRAEFRFRDGNTTILQQYYDITGTNVYGGVGTQLKVLNENGQPVEGVSFQVACGGSWQSVLPSVTKENGILFADLPSCMTKIRAKLGNSSVEQTLSELNNTNYTFTTQILQICLIDHAGNPITDMSGAPAQGGGTWINLGNLDNQGCIRINTFPVASARYRMNYNCNSQIKQGFEVEESAGIQTVTWQTGKVITDCGQTKYQGCGWSDFTNGMEQLPGTRRFRSPNVTFTVVAGQVNHLCKNLLKVVNENGNPVSGVTFQPACGGSWQSVLSGSTDASGYLITELPSCYTKLKATLGNSSIEFTKEELIASNYTFTTEIIRLKLINNEGNPISDQTGTAYQGGGTWISLGSLDANGSTLVNTFPVASAMYRMNYNCNSETKNGINITAGAGIQEIVWQTGMVISSCGQTEYQGCGWSTFTSGMQQLPGTRTFRSPSVTETVVAGQVLDLCGNNNNNTNTPVFGGSNHGDFSGYDDNNSPVSDMKNNLISDVVSVYPNPTAGFFNISIETNEDSKSYTSIVNISGKEILNFNSVGSTTFKVDPSSLSSGIYFVLTNINGKVTSTKLIVNN